MNRIHKSDISEITRHLQDDVSKTIFANRMLYAQTGDNGYLRNVCMTISETREFVSWIEHHRDHELVLFGAGQWGNWIKDTFDNYEWTAFVDNQVKVKKVNSLPVIDLQELESRYSNAAIIIASKYHWYEIHQQLNETGFHDEQIFDFGKLIMPVESGIYFDLPELPHEKLEVFADVGGYDGSTSRDFCKWCTDEWEIKIFEPDSKSQEDCCKTLLGISHIEMIPKGVWNEETVLSFESNGSESKVVEDADGQIKMPVTTIDRVFAGKKVTFIKMDIEGSELNALKGAEKTIRKHKPKLAISVYHKPEDMIEIPKLILKYNSDYRFWLRHYSMTWFDTVLYAV